MTVTMNAIVSPRTVGTGATAAVDGTSSDADTAPVDSVSSLLRPPAPGLSAEMLMELLITSAADTRKLHTANREIAAKQREASQKAEVDKLHAQADATLTTGVTTGLMEIGSAGLQGMSAASQNQADFMKSGGQEKVNPEAWKAVADTANDYRIGAELNKAYTGLNKAAGDAHSKGLEAGGKGAAAKASSAKDAYDNESDELHAQRDLKDAILKAYDALVGLKAQNASAFLGSGGQRG
jgi:hypothetical protein